MKQFLSFLHKEFLHIFRDKRTMLILLVMPIVLIILFGFAITTEVKDSRVTVLDLSKDDMTRRIREEFDANKYFNVTGDVDNMADVNSLLLEGKTDMVIVFGEDFAAHIRHDGKVEIQILADGSEPNQASVRVGYAQQVLSEFARRYFQTGGVKLSCTIIPTIRMLYNPQSKSEYHFVPGVIGLILMLICAMMSSIAIVKEKEAGTMEVLLASPLPPISIVLAKLVPYFVISCTNLATILLMSSLLLHIPIAGSITGFISVSLLYILVVLLLGLLISTVVDTSLAAMLLSLLLIVPTIYLSGIAFPIESMPEVLQYLSCAIPARWYVSVARKLMIQGVEMRYVMQEIVVLLVMAAVLLAASWRMFKTRLE